MYLRRVAASDGRVGGHEPWLRAHGDAHGREGIALSSRLMARNKQTVSTEEGRGNAEITVCGKGR